MDKTQAAEILIEFSTYMQIQRVLLLNCKLDADSRVPRGETQRKIAKELDLPLNHKFYSILDQVTSRLNLRKIYVEGKPYYKGLAYREPTH